MQKSFNEIYVDEKRFYIIFNNGLTRRLVEADWFDTLPQDIQNQVAQREIDNASMYTRLKIDGYI